MFYSHNFGHNGELNFHGLGINANMSELQAGMGLAVLPYVDELIKTRKKTVKEYDENLNFKKFRRLRIREGTDWNFSYYPIIFENEQDLLKVQDALNKKSIFPRRYFYPSLNTLNYVESGEKKVSEEISITVMCLPLYKGLNISEISNISLIIVAF